MHQLAVKQLLVAKHLLQIASRLAILASGGNPSIGSLRAYPLLSLRLYARTLKDLDTVSLVWWEMRNLLSEFWPYPFIGVSFGNKRFCERPGYFRKAAIDDDTWVR